MAIPDIANFYGPVTLQWTTGCTLQFNATISATIDRQDKAATVITLDFTSDGDITALVWDETGAGPTVVEGENASVILPAGFNLSEQSFTANIEVDRTTWATMASRWERNRPANGRITGTIVGVVSFDAANTEPVPSV